MLWNTCLVKLVAVVHSVATAVVEFNYITDINATNDTQLSILVSSLIWNDKSRRLIITWQNLTPEPGEWIGLFSSNPATGPIKAPLFGVIPQESNGWVTTDSYAGRILSGTLGYEKKCLGFWVAHIAADNTTVKSVACLKTEPTWMKDMQEELKSMKLHDIFIPGTHDSGSYKEYKPHHEENIVTKYTITQEEDILSQLIHGIRFLDIRVGYYDLSDDIWWTNHGLARIIPLHNVLDDIVTFIRNTDEIVIIDFHEFPVGFGSGLDVHKKLVSYVEERLGDYMVPSSLTWNARLGDVWDATPRLIVSYNKNEMVHKNPKLWPSVAQKWGNAHSLDDLHKYIAQVMSKRTPSKAWAVMAELTPSTWQVIIDELGGLRNMANMVNHNVTEWFEGIWGNSVNIVAVDFFRSTDIVNAAIKWNFLRTQNTCI